MILVTGGAGLVGNELIGQLLANGKTVRAIYHKKPITGFDNPGLEPVQCDILDVVSLEEVMTGIEDVYHCAGIVSFNPKWKREMFKVNIEGTANVVNAALDAGVRKLVHVSSVSALGRIRESGPVNETMNWTEETSNSAYGQSKYLSELEVWRGISEGLNAVIVNPVIILGAGDWNDSSSRMFRSAYEEFPWYTEGVSGFVDVRDVVAGMIALMGSEINAERFILSAENRSYRSVFIEMAKAFGKKEPYKKVTPLIASLVYRWESLKSIFTGREPLVTKETALTAMAKVNFDNGKLKSFIPGFSYQPIDDTIRHTCAALQQKLNKP